MNAAERIAVMEGELDGIDLVEILQVVSIGRQYTGVELRRADQSLFGSLFIKAGKVVAAVSGEASGKEAFLLLFQRVNQEPRKFFHVFRTETPPELPQPVGNLGNLLLEALERAKDAPPELPQRTNSGTMPKAEAHEAAAESSVKPAARVDTVAPPAAPPARPHPVQAAPSPPSSRRRSTPNMEASGYRVAPSEARRAPSTDSMPRVSVEPVARVTVDTVGRPSQEHAARPSNDTVARHGNEPAARPSGSRSAVASHEAHGHARTEAAAPAKRTGGDASRRIVLGIASPKGGSGKTTVSLNLALSFARQQRSVILVDADINGDVLSSIGARERAEYGAVDVLLEKASPSAALLRTVLPNFRIMPALGQELPDPALVEEDHNAAWGKLIRRLSEEAELVIIDTPAGMFGPTRQVASHCTHLLGVLQAELIASRSFSMFKRALDALPGEQRPEVVGVVLNMLQSRHGASIHVMQEACAALPRGWLLDTAIPRSEAFLNATQEGLPLRLLDDANPPAVSWLFDTLASELTERLRLHIPERQPIKLLL